MPFKVVQTLENGQLRLTAVPEQWEQNGMLFWPKGKQEKLRRQEACQPNSTWTVMHCIVKRRNLRTFQEAEIEINEMSDRSDTETDNEYRHRTKKSCISESLLTKPFNEMAKKLSENYQQDVNNSVIVYQETIATQGSYVPGGGEEVHQEPMPTQGSYVSGEGGEVHQETIATQESYVPALDQHPTIEENNSENQSILIELQNMQQIQSDIQIIKDDLKAVLVNQTSLFEQQNRLLIKQSELQTQFEGFIKLSSKIQFNNKENAMKLIKNSNDFEDFEKNLSNATLKEELRKKLSMICSKGTGKGTSNAYYLIDHLFDREFLKHCSWTGSSKASDTTKVCFKAFQNTIQFFFDIVLESDETFTKAACEKFFKIILKNARLRCESNKRMSAAKHRIKGKKTKKDTIAALAATPNQPPPPDNALPVVQPQSVTSATPNQPPPPDNALPVVQPQSVTSATPNQPPPPDNALPVVQPQSVTSATPNQPPPPDNALPVVQPQSVTSYPDACPTQ